MTPDEAVARVQGGTLLPLYLVVGEETYLRDQVLRAIRAAALAQGVPGLNDDQLDAGEARVEAALSIARTIPMMARRRLVVVRNVERWEPKGEKREGDDAAAGGQPAKKRADPFETLTAYAAAPVQETTLVLVAGKIDKRRKLVLQAKKEGWLVSCDALARRDLPRWIQSHARELGGQVGYEVADLVAELTGPELGPVVDAVERLVLYAGKRPVTEDDVSQCLVRLRPTEVWSLTDAIGRRDLGAALAALAAVLDPRDSGRLVGVLAWSTRQLLRFESALANGADPGEAAQLAGAPPFKAGELASQVRRTTRAALESWLETLSTVDLDLKGGSKRPAQAVFEHAIMQACAPRGGARRPDRGREQA